MKKSLLLLLLAIIAVSCSEKEFTPMTYKDIIGTYVGEYTLRDRITNTWIESGDATIYITGTSNNNVVFTWNDISIPVQFNATVPGLSDYPQAAIWYWPDTSEPKPSYKLNPSGYTMFSSNSIELAIILDVTEESGVYRYEFYCLKQ